ncbi:hypothetical protein [Roseibium sp.]|uniref:hypothetical protein n=1 Tax=Roseibium sp. TaxID=1936156 RepID=UPI003A97DFE0
MQLTPATAVALNFRQAKEMIQSGLPDGPILTFSPDATVQVKKAGAETIEIEDCITGFTHARILLLAKTLLDDIEQKLLALGYSVGTVEGCRIFLFNYVPSLLLLERGLANCDADDISIIEHGSKVCGLNRKEAFLRLAVPLSNSFDALLPTNRYGRVHATFCNLANDLLSALLTNRTAAFQLDHATPFTRRLCTEISSNNSNAAIISTRPPGKSLFASVRRALKSALAARAKMPPAHDIRLFRAGSGRRLPMRCPDDLPVLAPSSATLDLALRGGLCRYLPRIAEDAEAGETLANTCKPSVLVLDHLIQPSAYSAAVSFAARGVPSIMINHGSDTAQTGRLAMLGAEFWARHGRVNMPGLSTLLCKSPLTAPLAEHVSDNRPQILAINIGKKHKRAVRRPDEFVVVLAGNYRELHGYVPFVTETPGEYLRGLLEFARAAAEVDSMRLLVKLKPQKNGIPFEWLKDTLASTEFQGRVEIDTDTPFTSLFETMDLLVGNNSATLQEALDNRIPVFLNTWRRRYCHFPARFDPPTPDDRSAAYAVRKADDLVPMLTAIRDAHRKPLDDQELDGLVWTEADLQKTQEFLRHALDPKPC